MSFKITKANFARQFSLTEFDENIVFKYVRWRSKGRDNVNCLESLRDGVTLNVLVEEVTGMRINFDPNPPREKERKENIRVALEFLKNVNVDTCKLSATPVMKADRRTLCLLENIFKYDIITTLHGSSRPEANMDPYQEFIDWINKRIGPHLQVRNFTDYWLSGKALAALVNSFDSNLLADWRDWSEIKENHMQNTRHAMTEAQMVGVSMWITPEEMSSGKANTPHIAMYLFQFLKMKTAVAEMRETRKSAITDEYMQTTRGPQFYPSRRVQSDLIATGSPQYAVNPSPTQTQRGGYMPSSTTSPPFPPPMPPSQCPSEREMDSELGQLNIGSQPSIPTTAVEYVYDLSRDQAPPQSAITEEYMQTTRGPQFYPSRRIQSDLIQTGSPQYAGDQTPPQLQSNLFGASSKQRSSVNSRSRSQSSQSSVISASSDWSVGSGSACSQPKEVWFDEQQEDLNQLKQNFGEQISRDENFDTRRAIFKPRDEADFWLQLPKSKRDEYQIALKGVILEGEIRTKREIGSGMRSTVHEVRFAHPADGYKIVAAKSLAGDSMTIQDVMNFLDEARMMVSFKHPRVMTLECLVFSKGKPILLLPLQTNGNLQSYLKSQGPKITAYSLHQFCGDIAEGMAYLHDKANVVHRNLHAVNCLLDKDLRVKVDDFVRARETVEQSDYSVVNTEFCKRSWKIQAPEILDATRPTAHNYKTDVWAYGILLCTIYHYGDDVLNYNDIVDAGALLKYFKNRRVVQKPQAMPDSIYQLALLCLSVEPLDRPSFVYLVEELTSGPSGQATAQQRQNVYCQIDDTHLNQLSS